MRLKMACATRRHWTYCAHYPTASWQSSIARAPGDGAVLHGLLTDDTLAQTHAYVCLCTALTRLPAQVTTALGRLNIPIVAQPFYIDTLQDVVATAAARVAILKAARATH